MVTIAGPVELLATSVQLSLDLCNLAHDEVRYEQAAHLAAELRAELEWLSDPTRPAPRTVRRKRQRARRTRTSWQPVTLADFREEHEALASMLEQGSNLAGWSIADLRLRDRTRRVLEDASLDQIDAIAALTADQAMEIPNLSVSMLAEVRAALLFALELTETPGQRMLPPPREAEDLFEGVVDGIARLPRFERETVVMRTGTVDRVHTVEEVAVALGCPADQVGVLERSALNMLLAQPASLEACSRLEAICSDYGLGWSDERLPTVVASLYPSTRASYTRLVAWMLREKGSLVAEAVGRTFAEPRGIAHFEEMVVATLGRFGDLSAERLSRHLQAALPPAERELYPNVRVGERVQMLGPAAQREDGTFYLPDTPVAGVEDRNIRALNGLIGALQKLGSARISALTTEVNRRLPRQYHINDHYVRSWLTRHPDLFVQAEADRFTLATGDVDILCGLVRSWSPDTTAPSVAVGLGRGGGLAATKQQERVAKAIAEYLEREGPQPIWRIRSYLYGRVIGPASADTVIAAYPNRFVRQAGGAIALRVGDEPVDEVAQVSRPRVTLRGLPRIRRSAG